MIGQQFTWHYDAIQPHLRDSSGNRIATLIVYLNDCQEGGETVFRDLELKVCPHPHLQPVPMFNDFMLFDDVAKIGIHQILPEHSFNLKIVSILWSLLVIISSSMSLKLLLQF